MDAEVKKITAGVAAIPLKWSTKPQPPTMLAPSSEADGSTA
jgi:hypothetical protein